MINRKHLSFFTLLTGIVLLHGCAQLQFVPEDLDEDYTTTEKSAEEFIASLPYFENRLDAIEGRARAQISAPEGSDRVTVDFKANRNQSLLTVRNSVGIEGGRILADRDSVVIYDRLESEAFKMSHAQASDYYLQGMTAINLLEFIQPDFANAAAYSLFESETSFVLVSPENLRYFFDKDKLTLQQITFPERRDYAFSEINFENYTDFDGQLLPMRMQILSSDRETSIFLQLRSVTSNPSDLNFDPGIPSDITVRRV